MRSPFLFGTSGFRMKQGLGGFVLAWDRDESVEVVGYDPREPSERHAILQCFKERANVALELGRSVHRLCTPGVGGEKRGVGGMKPVAAALAGCSTTSRTWRWRGRPGRGRTTATCPTTPGGPSVRECTPRGRGQEAGADGFCTVCGCGTTDIALENLASAVQSMTNNMMAEKTQGRP